MKLNTVDQSINISASDVNITLSIVDAKVVGAGVKLRNIGQRAVNVLQ